MDSEIHLITPMMNSHDDSMWKETTSGSSTEQTILQPGDFLGPYRIVHFLGKGGMGMVYRARHTFLDRDVALKVVRFSPNNEQLYDLWLTEIRSSSNIRSDFIVQIFDAGKYDSFLFIAMEVMEGGDLKSHLEQIGGKLDYKQAFSIIRQVALGVQELHNSNYIHCDIKPSNILLNKDGSAKIADLGLADRIHNGSSNAHSLRIFAGTPAFMSPEQRSGRQLDTSTDIFSLGLTAYSILSGTLPKDQSVTQLPHSITPDSLVPLRQIGIDIPIDLDDLIQSMCRENQSSRINSMAEVVKRIDATLGAPERKSTDPKPINVDILSLISIQFILHYALNCGYKTVLISCLFSSILTLLFLVFGSISNDMTISAPLSFIVIWHFLFILFRINTKDDRISSGSLFLEALSGSFISSIILMISLFCCIFPLIFSIPFTLVFLALIGSTGSVFSSLSSAFIVYRKKPIGITILCSILVITYLISYAINPFVAIISGTILFVILTAFLVLFKRSLLGQT